MTASEKFKEATQCAREILESSTTDFFLIALGGNDDLTITCDGDPDGLACALAVGFDDNPELAKVFAMALAINAIETGKAQEIELPDSPTLN